MSSPRGSSHFKLPVESRKRKLSQISGLNTDGPVKRRHHNPNQEETNLWTTVKRYLKDPAGNPEPLVSCPICLYPIAIRGVPGLEPDPWKLADGTQKVGITLPCAHVLCQECFSGHIAAQRDISPTGQRTCPLCRDDLRFIGCKHAIPPQRLPVATSEDFSMVPLTMPELRPNEHLFPEECWADTAESCEEYIEVNMRFVSAHVHGRVYRLGEGPPEWEDMIEASQVLMWRYLSHLRGMPNWRNGSVAAGLLGVTFAGDGSVPVQLLKGFVHPDVDAIVYDPTTGAALWSR